MITKIKNKVQEHRVVITGPLFDSFAYLFTETQQWGQVIELLKYATPENSKMEYKTL